MQFEEKSYDEIELIKNPKLELDYIIAPPRMAFYMKYSTKIYNIYLKYFSEEELNKILKELVELDKNYKVGLIDLQIGLESILCRYCSK